MKKGKFKRAICSALALSVMLCTIPVVSAQDSSKLEKVILAVKNKVEIPAELSEFQSNVYTDEATGKTNYELNWYIDNVDEKYGKDEYKNQLIGIGVRADDNGEIEYIDFERSDIYSYIYDNHNRLSSLTRDEVNRAASEYIASFSPEHKDNLSVIDTTLDGINHTVSFCYMANGIPVESDGASISLVEMDGSLYPLHYSVAIGENKDFTPADNVIGTEKIAAIIKNDNPYQLNYHNGKYLSSRNYETLLQYSLKERASNLYYNALTGELVEPDYGIRFSYLSNNKEEAAADMLMGTGASLTEQELTELEAIDGLIPVSELEKYLRTIKVFDIPEDYTLSHSRISKENEEYFAEITLSKESKNYYGAVSAKLNAKTKEIIRYNGTVEDAAADKKPEKLTKAELTSLEKITDNFVNTYMPGKASFLEKNEQSLNDYSYPSKVLTTTYTRTIDAVPYRNNSVSVTVDRGTKKITGVYSSWTQLKDIPSADDVVSADTIIAGLADVT